MMRLYSNIIKNVCKKWSWLCQWTNIVMCIERIKATWCHKHKNYKGTFSEQKRLSCLNLSGTYYGQPSNRPPSCNTPRQLTIYVFSFINFSFMSFISFISFISYFLSSTLHSFFLFFFLSLFLSFFLCNIIDEFFGIPLFFSKRLSQSQRFCSLSLPSIYIFFLPLSFYHLIRCLVQSFHPKFSRVLTQSFNATKCGSCDSFKFWQLWQLKVMSS